MGIARLSASSDLACAPSPQIDHVGVGQAPPPAALIVDSNELFRAGLAVILRRDLGFATIREAGSLQSALEHFGDLPGIGLAVIDPMVLGADWARALRTIRARFPRTRLAVVTTLSPRRDILTALAAGVHGHVPKSLSLVDMVRALAHVLNGEVFVPPSLAEPIIVPERDAATAPELGRATTAAIANGFTPRQRDVLRLLIEGRSNKAIARALCLAEGTVKVHVNALYRTLDVHSRVGAIRAVATLVPKGGMD